MIDVQCGEPTGDEPGCSPEELNDTAQIEEWECKDWELQKNRFSRFGFVTFMDLLGFSQIASTDNESAIKSIFSIIKNCRDAAKKKLDEIDVADMPTKYFQGSIYDDIDISFISDSIVLHRDLPCIAQDEGDPNHKFNIGISAYWFIRLVREIFSDLLRKGLPSRCAVAYGNYFWDADTTSIMAGSALIEAHNVSESLAFPGIVGCKSIMDELRDTFDVFEESTVLGSPFINDFDIPLKGCLKAETVKGSIVRPNLTKDEVGDPEAFVTHLFKSYDKPVPEKFSWELDGAQKEVLYKLQKSIEVFKRLYARG